VAQDKR